MAATYWQGTTGDWGTAGNWSNGVPSPTNTPAVLNGRSQQDVTSGLVQTGIAFQLKSTRNYRGNLGAVGSPLDWSGAAGLYHTWQGSGAAYVETLVGSPDNWVVDGGAVHFTASEIIRLIVKRGIVTASSDTTFTGELWIIGADVVITIEERAATELSPSRAYIHTGRLIMKRLWDGAGNDLFVSGGVVDQTGILGDNVRVAIESGVLEYHPLASATGHTPVAMDLVGGLLDISKCDQVLALGPIRVGVDAAIKGSALQTEAAFLAAATSSVDFRDNFPDF